MVFIKLFQQLFQMSISASYLILAVLLVRFLLRKAPKKMRSFLWLLVGIRLLVPPRFPKALLSTRVLPVSSVVSGRVGNISTRVLSSLALPVWVSYLFFHKM